MRTLAAGGIAAEAFFFLASYVLGWFLGLRVANGSQPELTTVWCRLWRVACFSSASWPLVVFAFMAYGLQQVANRSSLATNSQLTVYWTSLLAIIGAFVVGQIGAVRGAHRRILKRTVCWGAPNTPELTLARNNAKDRILDEDRDECRNAIVKILEAVEVNRQT